MCTQNLTPNPVSSLDLLNVDGLKGLLQVQFSDVGSNKRQIEEQAWIYFCDFLDECEGKMDAANSRMV